jgi:hypothetical protein
MTPAQLLASTEYKQAPQALQRILEAAARWAHIKTKFPAEAADADKALLDQFDSKERA